MPRASIDLDVPSPVRRLSGNATGELWIKDDGQISSVYGGNKPRKLAHLLGEAKRRDAKRLVTVGAIGSHHVLATGLLGKHIGLSTTAVALPRPYSQHAEQTTKQILAAGVELVPLGRPLDLPRAVAALMRRDDYWIPPGGSSGLGALGYWEATVELKRQIDSGQIPEPDVIVVALGSGGTAAGLLAGIVATGIRSHLVAVSVLHLPMARLLVEALARRVLTRIGGPSRPDFSSIFTIDYEWVGAGYGHATAAGELAMAEAAKFGLKLESTYTGKAFAGALAWLSGANGRGSVPVWSKLRVPTPSNPRCILFWSTLSTVSLASTATGAATLPHVFSRLFRSS